MTAVSPSQWEKAFLPSEVTLAGNSTEARRLQFWKAPSPMVVRAAGKLMAAAARRFRQRELKVVPVCSYAVAWFQDHPEEADLLK